MNQSNQEESGLNEAIAAVMREPLDESAIARIQERASRIHGATPESITISKSSSYWSRLGGFVALIAASFLLVVWLFYYSASPSFAQVVEHVIQIRSVQFSSALQFHDSDARKGTVMIQGDVVRFEQGSPEHRLVSLVNSKTRKTLLLDTARKLAQQRSAVEHKKHEFVNPLAELVAAKEKSVKSLGRDWLNKKPVDIYRVKGLRVLGWDSEAEMTLWVDAETQLPAKIEMQDNDPKRKMKVTFDAFRWNEQFPDDLFSMNVPSDYKPALIVQGLDEKNGKPAVPDYSQDVAAGVLFSGRVPSRIEIDREKRLLTALVREPENNRSSMRLPNELRQWELPTGKLRWKQVVGGASELAICESKDLLAVVEGQEIQVRNLATGQAIKAWESDNLLGTVAFNRDGTRLAHGYIRWADPPTGGVEIWNVETGKLEHHIVGLDRVDAIQFSPTEEMLIVSSSDTTKLYNAKNAELEYSFASGSRATFSPDGKWLALVSADLASEKTQGRVDLMDLNSKKLIRSFVSPLGSKRSWTLSLAFSPDGSLLAAGDWNGVVSIWNTKTGDLVPGVKPLTHGLHSVLFLESNEIATGCEDGTLRLHKLAK